MLNNLEIKKFLWVILTIQLAILGLVGLAALGLDIPFLRQIVGFIYLAFIPGLLILRILKLRGLGIVETLLYSVGLSIAFVMATGFFMSFVFPYLGISRPISILPVILTIASLILIFSFIVYKQKSVRTPSPARSIDWSKLFSPPVLLLLLLPILSALGAFWVYLHGGNVLLLILLSLIVFIVILVAFGKFVPARLYPVAILAIAIALLWHRSLISPYLVGGDVYHGLPYLKLVLNNSIWSSNLPSNANAMLSIVMLTPIYSLVLKLDIVWILKIVYPLFFSLVPLALFQAYRKQTGDKIAFLGAFLFMSWPPFFTSLVGTMRMPIAELFLATSILLFVSKEMTPFKRATLLIIFGLSIVVSHYGTSYIYMLYLLIGLSLLLLWRSSTAKDLLERIAVRFSKFRHALNIIPQSPKLADSSLSGSTLTVNYVVLFIVFGLAWYMYVSSGSPLNSIVGVGEHIYSSLRTEFFSLSGRDAHVVQALGLAPMRGREVAWEIARIFQYITQLFIVIGILGLITNLHKTRFHLEYAAMSLVSMVIIGFSIILPYFALALNMSRIYHIALFFLAPFCVLGGIATFRWLFRVLRLHRPRGDNIFLKLVVISVLVPYFLFTTGFIFQITGATPISVPLSLYKADWPYYSESEMHASIWLSKTPEDRKVYGDDYCRALLRYGGVSGVRKGFPPDIEVDEDSYIFLRRWNVIHGEVLVSTRGQGRAFTYENLDEIELLKSPRVDKVYDSKEAQVLWYSK